MVYLNIVYVFNLERNIHYVYYIFELYTLC